MAPQPFEDTVTALIVSVAKYGLAPVLVCWFAWVIMGRITASTDNTERMMAAHTEASSTRFLQLSATTTQLVATQMQMVDLLRQTCVNAAENDAAKRNACFYAGRER